jgi:hypothetical protein
MLADVDGCNLLGKVIVADGPNAEKEARTETARLGGNVLLRKADQGCEWERLSLPDCGALKG